jgi:hypothetical protein
MVTGETLPSKYDAIFDDEREGFSRIIERILPCLVEM